MTSIQKTPVDNWIARKIGLPSGSGLTILDLQKYQIVKLRDTIDHAKKNSPFYADHLSGIHPTDLESLSEITAVPFITSQDLITHGLQMLSVSQSRIARVITLQTSGTTGSPKRIYFTEEDLELTADFFSNGMQALIRPGQKVMVLMPGPNTGSVGERLATALDRINCPTTIYGLVQQPGDVIGQIIEHNIDCLIGLPAQVLSLIRHFHGDPLEGGIRTGLEKGRIKSVLLSADYVPKAIVKAIEQAWECPVFTHWGMTETGLGGGVECQALQGFHLREADLLVEIVDPRGIPMPDGEWGEIVLTTLTRTGMPLIRYRTGDISRFLTGPCPCGSDLKRLDRVCGRSIYELPGGEIRLDEMDEALFALPEIIDFEVTVRKPEQYPDETVTGRCNCKIEVNTQWNNEESKKENQRRELEIKLKSCHSLDIQFWPIQGIGESRMETLQSEIADALDALHSIRQLKAQGQMEIGKITAAEKPLFSGGVKRKIIAYDAVA